MEKLFYKIGEVSRLTGLKPHVLRFWEKEVPTLRPKKSRGGQRVYTQQEIDLIFEMKRLLYQERWTIEGARKRLAMRRSVHPVLPEGSLGAVKKELEALLSMLS